MKNFNYQNELKKIVENKQLVQVYFHDTPSDYSVAYLLSADDDFITLAEIANTAAFDGVTIRHMSDVDIIKPDTIYLNELMKQITDDSLYQQAMKDVEGIEKFSFDGFISGLENTGTIVEILSTNGDNFTGKITGYDDEVLILEEYRSELPRTLSRAYIRLKVVAQISVDIPYLRIIARALADKSI